MSVDALKRKKSKTMNLKKILQRILAKTVRFHMNNKMFSDQGYPRSGCSRNFSQNVKQV